MIHLILL